MTSTPRDKHPSPWHQTWAKVRSIEENQRLYIRAELSHVRGFIPVLMKRRNGGQWNMEDRVILKRDLRALTNLSPYLIPLIMPGGVLLFPLFAWWLDCRRRRRDNISGSAAG